MLHSFHRIESHTKRHLQLLQQTELTLHSLQHTEQHTAHQLRHLHYEVPPASSAAHSASPPSPPPNRVAHSASPPLPPASRVAHSTSPPDTVHRLRHLHN